MPTITIQIEVPEGLSAVVDSAAGDDVRRNDNEAVAETTPAARDVQRYWREYLSYNGRYLYAAAARVERRDGPGYTLNDVAREMEAEYASTQSIHRTTGRAARKWKEHTGMNEPPIRLDAIDYRWSDTQNGMRTRYNLPKGVAAQILKLPQ